MRDYIVGFFTGVFVALVLIGVSRDASGAELTPEQARTIYAVTYGQVTGPPEWLDSTPRIRIVTQARMCEWAEQKATCLMRGAYEKGVVRLVDTLDFETPIGVSVLAHEFVHHLQWLANGTVEQEAQAHNKVACKVWSYREAHAYSVQSVLLQKMGDNDYAEQMMRRTIKFRIFANQCDITDEVSM